MSAELGNLNKAGRLIKLQGWLSLLMFLAVAAAVALPYLDSESPPDDILFIVAIVAAILSVSILFLIVGDAIKRNRKWAKASGVLLATISLAFVPIGTVIGVLVLYYLYNGWNETLHNT